MTGMGGQRMDLPAGLGYDVFLTKQGWVAVLVSRRGVVACTFPRLSPERALGELGPEADTARYRPRPESPARRLLDQFFAGVPVTFDGLRLDTRDVSPFTRAAWEACRSIPAGERRTYGWLAMAAGRPGAARAAGTAMARCRLAPIVPCQRVVGADGKMHGWHDPGIIRFLSIMEGRLAEAQREESTTVEINASMREGAHGLEASR